VLSLQNAVLAVAIGYALGSIPSGMIVARVYRNVDLTAHGSGRTGATNVLRTLGPGAAAIAFAADFLKGVLAVALVNLLFGVEPWLQLLTTLGAVLGHTYSPFLGFRGGRGVVTGLGATAVAAPWLMLIAFVVGILLVGITRYVSLGSVVGATLGGALLVAQAVASGDQAFAVWGVLVGGLIVVAHRDNIRRLLTGTERKLGEHVAT
jgi:acyl phosphate:glycerol-3-phosphate acyltransferase